MLRFLFDDVFWSFSKLYKLGANSFMYDLSFGFLPRLFKKDSVIFGEDDIVEEFYLIRKGYGSVGFTWRGLKYLANDIELGHCFGEYYIIQNRHS